MSFRPAGFRPAVVRYAVVLVFALSSGAILAQEAKNPAPAITAAKPAAAATAPAAAPAEQAAKPAEATAAVKPGDATAGQGKAAACGACHGMDGNSADPQYPKLAGQSEAYIVHQLNSFKSGKRQNPIMMGMVAPLSAQDMQDIGAYFASKRSLPGVADQALVERGEQLYRQGDSAKGVPACMACHSIDGRGNPGAMYPPGEQLYRQGDNTKGVPACMACHSIDGRGNPGAMYPQLTSQHAQYIEATLKAWHDGTVWGDDAHSQIMPGIAAKLDAKDIAAVASYVEGLHAAEGAGTSAAK